MTTFTAPAGAAAPQIPAICIIFEIGSIALLFAVMIAAVLWIHDHNRDWLYPAVVGFLFYMTLVYIMEQSAKIGFSFLASKNEWAAEHLDFFTAPILTLVIIGNVIALTVGMLYWRKQARKIGRPFMIGGAISFGFAFYAGALFTNGALSQTFQLLTNSIYVNQVGLEETITAYIAQGVDAEAASTALKNLTQPGYVVSATVLPAITTILSGVGSTAAAVLFYGVLSESLPKRWTFAVIGLIVLQYLPSIVALFASSDLLGYIFFGYDILLAAGSAVLAVMTLRKHMAADLQSLSYSRRKEKREAEKAARKMPKINMPKD